MFVFSESQEQIIKGVRSAMQSYFGTDQRRVDHALQVADFAREMLDYIEADPVVTMSAAYLHDIGIHEAERKHGSSAGHWQELEGPDIARQLLEPFDADDRLIVTVCELVGKHHTPRGVESAEFRILWDADALVNYAEVLPGKPAEEVEAILSRHMVTEAGYQMARSLFAPSR